MIRAIVGGALLFMIGVMVVGAMQSQPPPPRAPITPEMKAHNDKIYAQAKIDRERAAIESAAAERRFQFAASAVRQLRGMMNNPRSFELVEAQQMKDGALCVSYRATNAFNAIMTSRAVVAAGKIHTSPGDAFSASWNRHCGGKAGEDISHVRHAL
jgi:hypothetical protein